jgi:hypothetical protein
MPKVSWCAFLERHPAAHLVAGVLPEDEAPTSNARRELNLMTKLIARLAPKGLYALTVDREHLTPEIHCVFQKDSDVAEPSPPEDHNPVCAKRPPSKGLGGKSGR